MQNCSFVNGLTGRRPAIEVPWNRAPERVRVPFMVAGWRWSTRTAVSTSRVVWEYSPKSGGKSHLKLNNGERPIANKYREGKMQRTLKRELKVLEIVKREAIGTSVLRPFESAARDPAGARSARGPRWPPRLARPAGRGRCTLGGGVSASIGEVERLVGGRWADCGLLLQPPALGIASARSRRLTDVSTSACGRSVDWVCPTVATACCDG